MRKTSFAALALMLIAFRTAPAQTQVELDQKIARSNKAINESHLAPEFKSEFLGRVTNATRSNSREGGWAALDVIDLDLVNCDRAYVAWEAHMKWAADLKGLPAKLHQHFITRATETRTFFTGSYSRVLPRIQELRTQYSNYAPIIERAHVLMKRMTDSAPSSALRNQSRSRIQRLIDGMPTTLSSDHEYLRDEELLFGEQLRLAAMFNALAAKARAEVPAEYGHFATATFIETSKLRAQVGLGITFSHYNDFLNVYSQHLGWILTLDKIRTRINALPSAQRLPFILRHDMLRMSAISYTGGLNPAELEKLRKELLG